MRSGLRSRFEWVDWSSEFLEWKQVEIGTGDADTPEPEVPNPEEYAEMALAKILHVSKSADPMVQAQAQAFKEKLRMTLIYYLTESAKAERRTIVAAVEKAGQKQLADHIRAL